MELNKNFYSKLRACDTTHFSTKWLAETFDLGHRGYVENFDWYTGEILLSFLHQKIADVHHLFVQIIVYT